MELVLYISWKRYSLGTFSKESIMDNQTNRTLAYLLAEPIPEHELETISGGNVGMSAHQTVRLTGDSSQGPVMNYDVSLDI